MNELNHQDCNIQYSKQYEVVLIKGTLSPERCVNRIKDVITAISDHLKIHRALRVYFAIDHFDNKVRSNLLAFFSQLEAARSSQHSIRIFWLYPPGNNKIENLGYFLQTSFSMTFVILPAY
jgi:hypothetical protein